MVHQSTLAWKTPWTEEPGRLQSMGSLRVGHDWSTSLSLFSFMLWRRKWQPTPVFLPGESQGRGTLVGCCLWGCTVGHDWSNLACSHALEKEMASHSSVLAWRIPGTGEPGGLPSMGLHSRTWLKRLSSSSRSDFYHFLIVKEHTTFDCYCAVFCTTHTCHHHTIILRLWRFL